MKWFRVLLLYVIAPALALTLGCLGVKIIEENPLGWVLLVLGVGYPVGAILYTIQRKERFWL
jgi:hypothetical protein